MTITIRIYKDERFPADKAINILYDLDNGDRKQQIGRVDVPPNQKNNNEILSAAILGEMQNMLKYGWDRLNPYFLKE